MGSDPSKGQTPRRHWIGTGLGIALAGSYFLARTYILDHFPVHSALDWVDRDLLFTVPRVVVGSLALAIGWKLHGGWKESGWHLGRTRTGGLMLLVAGTGVVIELMNGLGFDELPLGPLAFSIASTVAVAIHEEAVFRGLLFGSLRKMIGPIGAAVLSSLVFAFWHWGVQNLDYWYTLFAFGIAACSAFEAGTGLVWLAGVHFLVDAYAMIFFYWRREPDYVMPFAREATIAATIIAVAASIAVLKGWRIKEES